MTFRFHVFRKPDIFVDEYISEPYKDGGLCRDAANSKRRELGPDFDVYYTVEANASSSPEDEKN